MQACAFRILHFTQPTFKSKKTKGLFARQGYFCHSSYFSYILIETNQYSKLGGESGLIFLFFPFKIFLYYAGGLVTEDGNEK